MSREHDLKLSVIDRVTYDVLGFFKDKEREDMTCSDIYFKVVYNSDGTVYKRFIVQKRDGYDVAVFACFKREFLDKLPKPIDEYDTARGFLEDLAKRYELGTFLHNPSGPAYGAVYVISDGSVTYPHAEYWLDGKRVGADEKISREENEKELHASFSEESMVKQCKSRLKDIL